MIAPERPTRPCGTCDTLGYRFSAELGHTVCCKDCGGRGRVTTPETKLEEAGQLTLLEGGQ